jgi:hypothetical protein
MLVHPPLHQLAETHPLLLLLLLLQLLQVLLLALQA